MLNFWDTLLSNTVLLIPYLNTSLVILDLNDDLGI